MTREPMNRNQRTALLVFVAALVIGLVVVYLNISGALVRVL